MSNKGSQFTFLTIWGPWGSSITRLCLSCFPAILSPIYCLHVKIRKQSDKKFKSKIWQNLIFVIFLGSWGPLRQTQEYQNFRAVRPHHKADIHVCITRAQITTSFLCMGHNVKKVNFFGYSGGPGWPFNNQTAWVLLASRLPSHMWHITHCECHGAFYATFFIILTNPPLLRDKWMDNLSIIQDMKCNTCRWQHCRNITFILRSHNHNVPMKTKCHQRDWIISIGVEMAWNIKYFNNFGAPCVFVINKY